MKNIHILPTPNPSKLHLAFNKTFILSVEPTNKNELYQSVPKNLYITNSEKPKEGDWVFNPIFKTVYQWIKNANIVFDRIDAKKIILTTDTDLIKDGVQAIDDEFLEWFVKNPNCDFVKTEEYISYGVDNWKYLITIP